MIHAFLVKLVEGQSLGWFDRELETPLEIPAGPYMMAVSEEAVGFYPIISYEPYQSDDWYGNPVTRYEPILGELSGQSQFKKLEQK